MTRRDKAYPQTPDGRYFVAKGRLWRKTDPAWTKVIGAQP